MSRRRVNYTYPSDKLMVITNGRESRIVYRYNFPQFEDAKAAVKLWREDLLPLAEVNRRYRLSLLNNVTIPAISRIMGYKPMRHGGLRERGKAATPRGEVFIWHGKKMSTYHFPRKERDIIEMCEAVYKRGEYIRDAMRRYGYRGGGSHRVLAFCAKELGIWRRLSDRSGTGIVKEA